MPPYMRREKVLRCSHCIGWDRGRLVDAIGDTDQMAPWHARIIMKLLRAIETAQRELRVHHETGHHPCAQACGRIHTSTRQTVEEYALCMLAIQVDVELLKDLRKLERVHIHTVANSGEKLA